MCRMASIATNFNTKIEVSDNKTEYILNIVASAALCNNIEKIILFGSVLTDECTDDSDIDFVVVSKVSKSVLYKDKSYRSFLQDIHKVDDYTQQYDVICVKGEAELEKKRKKVPLYNEVLTEGKIIYRKVDEKLIPSYNVFC